MKENKFYKISDKIFLAVTCLMIIFSVLSIIQYSIGYVGIVTEETVLYCSIMYGTPMMIFVGAITVSVQFLFIAARFKEIGYNEGNKFLITILALNIIIEFFWIPFWYYDAFLRWPIYVFVLAAVIAIIALLLQFKLIISHFKKLKGITDNRLIIALLLLNIILEFILIPFFHFFDMQEIFYFWFPFIPFIAQATKKDFRKGSDKLLTFVTWFMGIIFVAAVIIAVLEYNCVMPHAPRPITNIAMALDTPVTLILTALTILAQLMFILSHIKLLKGNPEGMFIITILILNIILEVPVVALLCAFDLQFIFYLWVPIVLFAAEFTKKRFFKAEEK